MNKPIIRIRIRTNVHAGGLRTNHGLRIRSNARAALEST